MFVRMSTPTPTNVHRPTGPTAGALLGLTGAQVLYGRRNTLFDADDRPLAEIVEILPPAKCKEE